MRHREPDAATILPADAVFGKDHEFAPLQAADLFAWTIRKATNDPDYKGFHWLIDELSDIATTPYSQYYDADRMQNVATMTEQYLREGGVPSEVIEKYREILED